MDDPDVWVPSIEGLAADGPVVGVLGQATRLRRDERPRGPGPAGPPPAPAAPDVVELLRFLRAAGVATGLYASEVRPEIWAAAERRNEATPRRLVAYLSDDDATVLELPVSRTGFGELLVALEDRGINVFVAPSEDALAAAVGRHLAGAGFLRFPAEVELHDVPRPRAERLDPATIAFNPEPEEVRSPWSSP
jgi:hypothetical protein